SRVRHQAPQEVATEIMRAVARHAGQDGPEDDQALVVVQIGKPVVGTRLAPTKTLEEKESVLSLMNAGGKGAESLNPLCIHLKSRCCQQGFEEPRIRQIWAATWEAIQNAVKYGSRPGDVIHIQLIPPRDDRYLEVELRQPLLWEDWDTMLGDRKKSEVHN